MNDIKKLEDELAEVEKAKAEYEASLADESQSQGRDVHLEDEQVRDYHRLKEEAAKRSARYMQNLDSVNREQKADQDRLDSYLRARSEAENRYKQKESEKEEMEKRMEKLKEHIRYVTGCFWVSLFLIGFCWFLVCNVCFLCFRNSEQALQEQKKLREELQSDVGSSKDRVQDIQKQLEEVMEQLGDARIDKHEDARRKKKQEIVERFKSNYSGVVSPPSTPCTISKTKINYT